MLLHHSFLDWNKGKVESAQKFLLYEVRKMEWHPEEKLFFSDEKKLVGVDEAGRGPLAGPVVVAAVILPDHFPVEILEDSKKITAKKRESAYLIIKEQAIDYQIIEISSQIVDEINILQGTLKGMAQSVKQLTHSYDRVVVDGRRAKELPSAWDFAIGGDRLYGAIAAASILAKVHRDQLMVEWDEKYPMYGFSKNKGYGSKAHMEAIRNYGPCPIHRRSFDPLRTWLTEIELFSEES